MIYLQLLYSFFKVGLFSFGGGYASIPLIEQEIVLGHQWITSAQMTDLIAISQMTPGPVAINASTFVGVKVAGIFGGIVATIGCILPSCLIMSVLAWYFFKKRELKLVQGVLTGVRPVVIGMIASVCATMALQVFFAGASALFTIKAFDWKAAVIFVTALAACFSRKIHPIIIMIASGLLGLVFYYLL